MKRYSVSIGRKVGTHYSEKGWVYHYRGRTDDPEKYIAEHKGMYEYGFKITDSKTKETIYQE